MSDWTRVTNSRREPLVRWRIPLTIVIGVLFATWCGGQTVSTADSHAGARIGGIVVKLPNSEPVKKAIVELIAENQNETGNYTALTGGDGAFHIEDIHPGRYRLFVERPGLQQVEHHRSTEDGRVLVLAAGQEIKDISIRLQASAVIEGRITDEDGDPMPDAQVAVLRSTFVSGHSHWEQAGAERTNDLGDYRVANLSPGPYFLSVSPPPNFRSLIETNSPVSSQSSAANKAASLSYQTTYYPGTRDRSQATAIQLHSGDDFPINFSLTPTPSFSIHGAVTNLPAGATAAVMLHSKEFSVVLNGAEVHKDGTFEIRDVSPGSYTVFASVDNSAVPMTAHQSLQLTSSNIEGIRLSPQPGATISGRLRLEPSSVSVPDISQFFLELRPAEGEDFIPGTALSYEGMVAHVNANGSFEWKDLPPGRYFVQISAATALPNWRLKSVLDNGRDASEAGVSINGGAVTLDLVASADGGVIEGTVTEEPENSSEAVTQIGSPDAGQLQSTHEVAASDITVVAVPEARLRAYPDHYCKAQTDQSGHFTLRGLAPGSYTLFAWESVEGEAYYNPEFLSAYEGSGKSVRVNANEHVSVQLKAIPAADER